MDIRKIKKIIDLISHSNMAEIEIKEGKDSLKIVRSHNVLSTAQTHPKTVEPQQNNLDSNIKENIVQERINQDSAINSPMVGTFYAKPAPDAAPFVKVGDKIKVGDIICIIEAMKIMNKIEADKAGIVKAIKPSDGDAVEFGQELILLK